MAGARYLRSSEFNPVDPASITLTSLAIKDYGSAQVFVLKSSRGVSMKPTLLTKQTSLTSSRQSWGVANYDLSPGNPRNGSFITTFCAVLSVLKVPLRPFWTRLEELQWSANGDSQARRPGDTASRHVRNKLKAKFQRYSVINDLPIELNRHR